MRYILTEDIEIVKTVNLIGNASTNTEKICENLNQQYLKEANNYKIAFAYGYLNFLLATKAVDSIIGNDRLEIAFNAYSHVLELVPDYWLVQLFKSLLLFDLPEVMRNDDELEQILIQMIDQQKDCKQEAYFIIPYILYADFGYIMKGRDFSFHLIMEAENNIQLKSLDDDYFKPCFYKPVKNFYKRLARSNETTFTNKLKNIGSVLFPSENIFKLSGR